MSATPVTAVRRALPLALLLLEVCAGMLGTAPWLRAFPVSLAGAPLFGAAAVSLLVPLAVAQRWRRLWVGAVADVLAFVVYTLVVVLHDPVAVGQLASGLYHGPAQLLTFALPLVSPRSLMVAPVALTWLAGAVAGECLARSWRSLLPYVGFLLAFGLAYAGSERAAGSDLTGARERGTLLAAGLLVTLLAMRVAEAWIAQDENAESTQPDGVLPLRGLGVGGATTLAIALVVSLAVQTSIFPKRSAVPQRVPGVNESRTVNPLSFVSGLRPATEHGATTLFTVTVNRSSTGYFPLANLDQYDGSGWSFTRTFRPSGGVLPADADPELRGTLSVTQQYRITSAEMAASAWMPSLYRPRSVTGTAVNIDPTSGMIVPAGQLRIGSTYLVRSTVDPRTFADLPAERAVADTATPTTDVQLPPELQQALSKLVAAFTQETGVPSTPALPFLQALQHTLQTHYALSVAAAGSAPGGALPASSATPTPTPTAAATPSATTSPGGTSTGPARSASAPHSGRAEAARRLDRPAAPARSTPARSTPARTARPAGTATPARAATPRTAASARPAADRSVTAAPGTPVASPTSTSPGALAGSTGFADVLASILGSSRSGTPEQYATLVALVARQLGVPARLATGFRVLPMPGATHLGPGQYAVTSADAWTWAEVPIVGVGWTVLDASPSQYARSAPQTQTAAPAPTTTPTPSQPALGTQSASGHAVAPRGAVPVPSTTARDAVLLTVLALIGALILVLLVILLTRKRIRAARRRRAADPRDRLIGAWQESIDVLTEAGLPELATLTSAEIAELTREQFGAEPGGEAAALGAAANAVTYSSATVVADDDAAAAWDRVAVLRRAVQRQLGVRGRMAAGVRYHRTRDTRRPVSPASWTAAAGSEADGARPPRGRRTH